MRKVMSMSEVLANISLAKKKMSTINAITASATTNYKAVMFMSLANPMKDQDMFGRDKKQIESTIQSNWDASKDNFMNYLKYSMIKEQVNATHKIKIPNPDYAAEVGSEIEVTIAEALILNTTLVKNHYENILKKMRSDYNFITEELKKHNETVLSEEAVSKYISTILSAQGEKVQGKIDVSMYSNYAKDYTDANKMEIIDPINIAEKIEFLEDWMDKFYTTIGYRLSEFNSTVKVWVDLDLDQDFWGYYSEDSDN